MTTSIAHHAQVSDRIETVADLIQATTIVLATFLGFLTVAATF